MSYDALGPVYDQHSHAVVAGAFYRAIEPMLGALNGGTVLDLGCGTGLLTGSLAARAPSVLGIDRSPRMLDIARARCRRFGSRVDFELADLRTFSCARPAAAAFACADVVNHFLSERQLARFFRNVSRNLEPGATFAFDALNRWCFENYWLGRVYHFAGKSGDILMDCDWDAGRGVGTASMVIYERSAAASYERRRAVLRERLYESSLIERLLHGAGFSRASCRGWSPWPDQREEASVDRNLWVAVR